ncbi:hypothetical protein ACLRDC_20365 [Gluconacetobacter sacchari]|uniref:hypothetical protein n=1 Tax=Gluconacetobacter sacchari TaxID=92759 RepID=UPI0039B51569
MAKDTIGIDVSKDRLDAFWHSRDEMRSLPNTAEGFEQLCSWLEQNDDVLFVFEATGAGGFNRSSQHLNIGGVDDDRETEIGAVHKAQIVLARTAACLAG